MNLKSHLALYWNHIVLAAFLSSNDLLISLQVDSTADSNDESAYNTDLNSVSQENRSSQDWDSECYNSNLNIKNIQEDFV